MSLFHALGQLWSREPHHNKSHARRRKRTLQGKRGLRFETLENRSMLAVTDVAGGSQPHENLQSYIAMNYVIATEGIFPSPNLGDTPYLGAIDSFAGTFAPVGFAMCDGSLLPISQYNALFNLIGTTYGGDGQTTFAVPDLRGRVPVGVGQGIGLSHNYVLGEASGVEMVTLTSSNLENHTHTVPRSATPTDATGGSQPFENRQPTLALTPVIALQGIFPSANLTSQDYLGSVSWTACSFAPRGYAIAAGQLLPIAQNQALFSLLGTTYGGNGTTNFALPDLRGRIAVSAGGSSSVQLGEKGGTETVTPTLANLPNHVHTISGTSDLTGVAGGSQPFDNRQPFLALSFEISLQGIYPSRSLAAGDSGAPEPIGQGFSSGDVTLDEATARPLIDSLTQEAIRRWQAAGISDVQIATLQAANVVIGDLPPGRLASAGESLITLDRDASNRGWYLDVTPGDNVEFDSVDPHTGELVASDPTAGSHYDLLTALIHEQGHLLGLNHTSLPGHIMYGGLSVGARILPAAADLVTDGSTPPAEQFLEGSPYIASVSMFAGNFAARGWSFTTGQLLPISQNTALFSLLGTNYGGDGRTNFALPNTQGRAIIGAGQGPGLSSYILGQTGGQDFVTLSIAEIPAHTHTFVAAPAAAPSVTSPTAASVTASSATLGGNVTADNGATITERGVLVSKTSVNNSPQLNGIGVTKLAATGTTGVFTVAATGLDLTTGYSYVAFATNSVGTTYTTVDTFTTLAAAPSIKLPTAASVTANSATLGGNVIADNGAAITERGILVSKTSVNNNPQLNGNGVTKLAATGTTGVFTVAATGLDLATGYSYVAFATNSVGTSYTTVDAFTTSAAAPTVTSPTAVNVTANSATLGGNVTADNGATITERGILLSKTSVNNNPQLNGNGVTKLTAAGTTGVFTVAAAGLNIATGYSYVAFATNSAGTTYTTVDAFTTLATAPAITSPTQANITSTSATLGGNVTADNGAAITERGILVSKTSVNNNPLLNGNGVTKLTAAGTTGVFTVNATGLNVVTGYSYVAFATNAVGTTYTTVTTFSTIGVAPTVISPTATNIGVTTAKLGGNVTSDGQAAITERGIVYAVTSLNGNPQLGGVAVAKVTTTGTTGSFTIDVSPLPAGTKLSYAAYATNAVGTSYSSVSTFTTYPNVGQLAGVTVQVIGSQLIITGDNKADQLKLVGTANANEFIVTGLNGTIVNGVVNQAITTQDVTAVTWNLTNGADVITMDKAAVAGSVTIGGGTGTKSITLGKTGAVRVGGSLSVNGGAGNGSIFVTQTTIVSALTITGGQSLGNNTLTTTSSSVGGNLSIVGGPGYDLVQQTQVAVGGQWNINVAAGNDVISIANCSATGAATFTSGIGTDTIAIGGSLFRAGVTLDGSLGNGIKTLTMYGTTFAGMATLNGGALNDSLTLDNDTGGTAVINSGGGQDNVLVQYSVLDALFASLGDGNDILTVRGSRIRGYTQLYGGPGTNFFANLGNIFEGSVWRNLI